MTGWNCRHCKLILATLRRLRQSGHRWWFGLVGSCSSMNKGRKERGQNLVFYVAMWKTSALCLPVFFLQLCPRCLRCFFAGVVKSWGTGQDDQDRTAPKGWLSWIMSLCGTTKRSMMILGLWNWRPRSNASYSKKFRINASVLVI